MTINLLKSRILSIVIFLFFAVSLFGCAASFKGNELSEITTFPPKPEIADIEKKPSVSLYVSWHRELRPLAKKEVYIKSFEEKVVAMAKELKLFGEISTNKYTAHKMDYKIEIDMLNHGNFVTSVCLGGISGASLMIIPAYARDNYVLTASVSDSRGILKKYQYKDHLNSWFHLLLLPVAPATKNTGKEVIENMLKHLFNDIAKDNFITLRKRNPN